MTVQTLQTVIDVDPAVQYHYEHPFLIVSHVVEDIGLVGWNNKRWTHQDNLRKQPSQAPSSAPPCRWMQAFDPDGCKYYFYNINLGITTWEEPEEEFEADETVQYYTKIGIAPPWKRSNDHSEREVQKGLEGHSQEHVVDRGAQQPALATTAGQVDQPVNGTTERETEADVSSLLPACVKFAPARKGDLHPNVERYWILRYSLFSRWSSGAYLDETSLFSVTPEIIAKHHARMLKGGGSVLDAFCGCGGNTIALAQQFDRVVACDIDGVQLEMAKRNCEAYGVGGKVSWVHGDIFKSSVPKMHAVFLSPPWGGPGDAKREAMRPFDATLTLPGVSWSVKDSIEMACAQLSTESLLLDGAGSEVPNIAVYLPRNTLLSSLRQCLDVQGFQLRPLCLERNVLNGKLKTVTMYLRCSALGD